MAEAEANSDSLYLAFHKQYVCGNYEKALSAARKIGRAFRDDKTAQQCIAVCCLQVDRYEDCLDVINRRRLDMPFEKAYCQYRLNKTEEAEKTLMNIPEKSSREKELLAQIFYRQEKFDDCVELYQDLIRNVSDDHDEERLSNYCAALAAREQSTPAGKFSNEVANSFSEESGSYELLYNLACGWSASGDASKARKLLEKSLEVFKESNVDELSEEQMNEELAIVRVQLGFVLQQMGHLEEATEVYSMASQDLEDATLQVIVANNLLAQPKVYNHFDAKKKMKTLGNAGKAKLTGAQKKVVDFNLCLGSLSMSQIDQSKKHLAEFKKLYVNDSEMLPLLSIALLVREKKFSDAIDYLAGFPELELVKIQVLLLQGSFTQASQAIKANADNKKLFLVSLLVALFLSFEEPESALEVVNEALSTADSTTKVVILKGAADYFIEMGLHSQAITLLEKVLDILGPEKDVLAQLINCSSKVDPNLVKNYSANLPTIEDIIREIDLNQLEESGEQFLMNKYNLKKATKTVVEKEENILATKNSKRKKKPRLPKNYDPSVQPDPERWLPRWERSAFKKTRKKKQHDVGKGTQGAASGSGASSAGPGASSLDHSGPGPGPSSQASASADSAPQTSSSSGGGARPKTGGNKKGRGGKRR